MLKLTAPYLTESLCSGINICNKKLKTSLQYGHLNRCYSSNQNLKANYNVVAPQKVSTKRSIPDFITKPPYLSPVWKMTQLFNTESKPEIKNDEQIQRMRDACRLARDVLTRAGELVKPGLTTDEIDAFVHNESIRNNAYPSPLLYKGFPKSVCTSVNNVACHGIPDDRPLQEGDILNIDITVYYNGHHGDCSEMFLVGECDIEAEMLVVTAEQCRDAGIDVCGPGVVFQRIGEAIACLAAEFGYSVIPDFCGHGIGSYFHGSPDIIHVPNIMPGRMLPGMTFTVEPVITEGDPAITLLSDGWTAVSVDNSRSAQFEHTILITEHGVEVLTLKN